MPAAIAVRRSDYGSKNLGRLTVASWRQLPDRRSRDADVHWRLRLGGFGQGARLIQRREVDPRAGIASWIGYYNTETPHSALDGRTPEEVFTGRDAPSAGHAPETVPVTLAA